MKLYSGPVSLFSKKVEIALYEKGLAFERVLVPFSQLKGYQPTDPVVLAANPKRQVPVLIDGSVTLYDSTVILEYLDDAYPSPALFPQTPAARAECRLLDLFADEIMLTPIRAFMHRTEPRPKDSESWRDAEAKTAGASKVLLGYLDMLEGRLSQKEFLLGAFSAADISVFMEVFWARRLAACTLRSHGALARWYERLEHRPSFARAIGDVRQADLELSAPVDGAYA